MFVSFFVSAFELQLSLPQDVRLIFWGFISNILILADFSCSIIAVNLILLLLFDTTAVNRIRTIGRSRVIVSRRGIISMTMIIILTIIMIPVIVVLLIFT